MNGITLAILIIVGLIGLFILYKILKPYFIKHDTTMCIVGGLGSGKTLTCVKRSIVLLRKQRIKYYYIGNKIIKVKNFFKKIFNKIRKNKIERLAQKIYNTKQGTRKNNRYRKKYFKLNKKGYMQYKPLNKKPMLYCNIPIHFKSHLIGLKREWNITLKASHILCLEEIIEYSIVFIDELPQFINQFNWNQELIQKNVNEFITFFRHYIGGYFITNAQAIDDIVVQIRRKLNQATWCFDYHAWPLPFLKLFYTIRMCDMQLSDQVNNISTTFIEDNTKLHFALFPPRKTYDTRCYSERYKNIFKKAEKEPRYTNLKTNKVLRLVKYVSPLDDTTTEEQKQTQWQKGEEIWKN